MVFFVLLWMLLIAAGAGGTMWYTEQARIAVTSDLERQTSAQIAALQSAYDQRLAQVEQDFEAELTTLSGKVDQLNELLTFTKDNATDRTDNSNKLYSQINEVKKQLDELKKSLDVLK
ncbi:hypothetical protein IDH44_18305 [Paenibacillus sp. IB182496]|uniref:Uncharacterized protein n=1 Tax=Paenibacillus sabuli TaxID=2772509 RepID=A0A927GTB1_9BACL|nr:hypothetical protein [Paenibacillus sabuli]